MQFLLLSRSFSLAGAVYHITWNLSIFWAILLTHIHVRIRQIMCSEARAILFCFAFSWNCCPHTHCFDLCFHTHSFFIGRSSSSSSLEIFRVLLYFSVCSIDNESISNLSRCNSIGFFRNSFVKEKKITKLTLFLRSRSTKLQTLKKQIEKKNGFSFKSSNPMNSLSKFNWKLNDWFDVEYGKKRNCCLLGKDEVKFRSHVRWYSM